MFSISKRFHCVSVLIVGDVMIDRYTGGAVNRISPESPVPVLHVEKEYFHLGGAANVARNVAALDGRSTLVGVVGNDESGRDLDRELRQQDGIEYLLVIDPERRTTEKIRFVSHGQHMLRTDRETAQPIARAIEDELLSHVQKEIGRHQVLVLSDYAKGVLTDRVLAEIISLARSQEIPVVVDPKSPVFSRYAGATVITPNTREIALATGIDPTTDATSEAAGRKALLYAECEAILLTRAESGMTLVTKDKPALHVQATARQVFDVVGAGDTVVAVLSLCLGAALPLLDAAKLANIAAGIVVSKEGTATVTQTDILDELNASVSPDLIELNQKVMSWDAASARCRVWLHDGKSIGLANGCFDVLHAGHVRLLQFAKANCDRLIVAINSDASIRKLKGSSRPINNEADRAAVLSAIRYVDAVITFEQDTPKEAIEFLRPSILVKGADYSIDQIVGADFVLSRGGRVLTCELLTGRSTTQTIGRMRDTSTSS